MLSTESSSVLKRQSDLVEYWTGKCGAEGLPRRRDLNPGELRAHLASLSIVQVEPGGQMRFRLAGSAIVRILGRDLKGCGFSVLPHAQRGWWIRQVQSALERKEPVMGVRKGQKADHIWVRAPLIGDDGRLDQVLCHDQIISHVHRLDPPTANPSAMPFAAGLAA